MIATIIIFLPLSKLNSLNLIIVASVLSLVVVSIETYGRLRRDQPLFGKCDEDIVADMYDEKKSARRYVRWRWGSSMNLRKKRSSIPNSISGIFKRSKNDDGDNVKINDNQRVDFVVEHNDDSQHL